MEPLARLSPTVLPHTTFAFTMPFVHPPQLPTPGTSQENLDYLKTNLESLKEVLNAGWTAEYYDTAPLMTKWQLKNQCSTPTLIVDNVRRLLGACPEEIFEYMIIYALLIPTHPLVKVLCARDKELRKPVGIARVLRCCQGKGAVPKNGWLVPWCGGWYWKVCGSLLTQILTLLTTHSVTAACTYTCPIS